MKNTKSFKNIIGIIENEIDDGYKSVRENFQAVIKQFNNQKKCVKWIILAETPVSSKKYFYNPKNNSDSSFLKFDDFPGKIPKNKEETIYTLVDNGILIVDIYPFPISSKYYKDPRFYEQSDLDKYWDEVIKDIKSIRHKCNSTIVYRYKKFYSKKGVMLDNANGFIDALKEIINNDDKRFIDGGKKLDDDETEKKNYRRLNKTEFHILFNKTT